MVSRLSEIATVTLLVALALVKFAAAMQKVGALPYRTYRVARKEQREAV